MILCGGVGLGEENDSITVTGHQRTKTLGTQRQKGAIDHRNFIRLSCATERISYEHKASDESKRCMTTKVLRYRII